MTAGKKTEALVHNTERRLSGDIFPLANFYNVNRKILVINRVNDTVSSLSYPILLLPGQFFAATWPRIIRESSYTLNNTLAILFCGNLFNFFDRRRFDKDVIFCHAVLNLSEHFRKVSRVHVLVLQTRKDPLHPQRV